MASNTATNSNSADNKYYYGSSSASNNNSSSSSSGSSSSGSSSSSSTTRNTSSSGSSSIKTTSNYGSSSIGTTSLFDSSSRYHGTSSRHHDDDSDESENMPANYYYNGGNMVIDNYAGERIYIGELPAGLNFINGNFYFQMTTGLLAITNARDKFIDFRDGASNELAKAYAATLPMAIDFRPGAGVQYLVGSEAGSNTILAGNGCAYLWGNVGTATDVLVGGAGNDTFFVGKNEGNDAIQNSSAADSINLYDVTLSDITFTAEDNGTLGIAFNTGNVITVQSTDYITAKINLADGSSWRFNHQTKAWQSA